MRLGRAAGITDTGRRRLRNEDAFICEPPLFAVADGMGGARAGEIAAGLAAAALEEGGPGIDGADGIEALVVEANRRIWERSLNDPQTTGMGAVATAALVDERAGTVVIAHVGDSRAYRLRNGEIEQLTNDHSLVSELIESGVLTPEEAERHPQRSAITRALGTEPSVEVDMADVDAVPGDLFLLCSDGLTTMLADAEIVRVVASAGGSPADAAEALVAAANDLGSVDNVTVVLFEIVGDDEDVPESVPRAVPAADPAGSSGEGETAAGEQLEDDVAPADEVGDKPGSSLRRHGAGAGGRLTAIALLLALVAIGLLALYWEFR